MQYHKQEPPAKIAKLIRFVPPGSLDPGFVSQFDVPTQVNRIDSGWYLKFHHKQKEVVWRAERDITVQEIVRVKRSWLFGVN